MSLLQEIPHVMGTLAFNGSLAYVEQEPIVFSRSIRENIIFGKPFDTSKYQKVIKACCLETDFTLFEYGDQTIVGEKGSTLSGG